MKNKLYTAIGLMSGTSMDGVDASLIRSNGNDQFTNVLDEYYDYDDDLYRRLIHLRNLILNNDDLNKHSQKLNELEKEITLFHSKIVNEITLKYKGEIDFVGFHGQTIFHDPEKKISKQLGQGKLLSQLVNKKVIYDFRQEDIANKGQGAPLTPIFHKLIKNKYNLRTPLIILNIGGIANLTSIDSNEKIQSRDIGPGNCLIDQWIRLNSEKHYDHDGNIAKSGKINKEILNIALKNFKDKNDKKSYDVKDFDLSFVKRLSLKDGAATLTEYTSEILYKYLKGTYKNIIISGGGRKNKFLLNKIEKKINYKFKLIDDFKINGDFIESQAFAYLAIRSYLNLPISFPETTGVNKPCTGGEIIKY